MSLDSGTSGAKLGQLVPVVLQCTNLGGMEQVAFSLMSELSNRGFRFRFATPKPWGSGKIRALEIDPEARAFPYRGRFGWKSFGPYFRHLKPIVHSRGGAWVIGNCASSLMAVRLAGGRALLSHHYPHFLDKLSRVRWLAFYTLLTPALEAITYPSEFTRREAINIAPWLKSRTHVVRNGVRVFYTNEGDRIAEMRNARVELGLPQDAFVVGNAGWLIRSKRFDVFLHSASLISKRIPKALFIVCGGGEEDASLRKLASDLGIAEKVRFMGWVTNMQTHYRSWDVVLFNSDFDAMPTTPIAAASHGCVGVASCVYGGLSEFLKDGVTGVFTEKHDPEYLAEWVVRLANEPALALAFREEAVALLKREFNPNASVDFYEAYFSSRFI